MTLKKLRDLLFCVSVLAAACAPQARAADLCYVAPPVSNGCSTYYTEWISGEIMVFRNVFNSACNNHDICYEQLGKTRAACDGDFRAQTKDKCDSINRYFFPGEWYACRSAASAFATAVEVGGKKAYDEAQAGSLLKHQKLAQEVATEQCGSTPERAKIYSVEAISYVNNSFQSRLGRAPSVYEQFAAINASNPAGDQLSWRIAVDQYAESHRYLTPPTVAVTFTANARTGYFKLSSTTSAGAANHHWRINGQDTYAPTYEEYIEVPLWNDINASFTGYITVVAPNGQKAMAVVDRTVVIRAECPTGICP